MEQRFWKIFASLCLMGILSTCAQGAVPSDSNIFSEDHSSLSARQGRKSVVSGGLFSIVSFDNVACNGTNGDAGTCYSSKECDNLGGTSNGRCAGNYGVCCSIYYQCSSTIASNNSYFVNPNYPNGVAGPLTCSVTVKQLKGATQLYLEFTRFGLRGPTGPCTNDTFTVTIKGKNTTLPVLCGTNDNAMIYIPWSSASSSGGLGSLADLLGRRRRDAEETEVEGVEMERKLIKIPPKNFNISSLTSLLPLKSAMLTFNLASGADLRYWKMRIVQFPAGASCGAPSGCTQYFQGLTGTFESFNYNGGNGELISTNSCVTTCFAVPSGYCSMTFTETSFLLPGTAPSDCTTDYLTINGVNYCGDTLGTNGQVTATVTTGQNYISVQQCSGSTNPDMDLGFSLNYMLQPCT